MQWDLSSLFADTLELEKTLKDTASRAHIFKQRYKNTLASLSSDEFLAALGEFEAIKQTLGKIMTYAFLLFASDTNNGSLYAHYQKETTDIEEHLLFFELEFNQIEKEQQNELIKTAGIYAYYLHCLQEEANYQLSEKEERILLKKGLTSSSAFSRLFDEHLSHLLFDFEGQKLPEEKILSLLYHPDRSTRRAASLSLARGLEPHQDLLCFILNMVKTDWAIECELRGYKDPEEPRHLSNRITKKSVDALVETATANYSLVESYYKAKASLLGFKKLYDFDRYAPLRSNEKPFDYETSKQLVLDAFKAFSPLFYEIAQKAFDEGWIDAFPRERKQSGAFSHGATPDVHPYVMLNFTDTHRDVFTLAHELGHAIHQYLAREVGYLNQDTPLTTAETASIFAEMLLFETMKKSLAKEELLGLYASKIEDIFATLFRQIIFTRFERRIHAHKEELSKEKLNQIWFEENQQMFGDGLELTDHYKTLWSYIPHFVHSPFYCYAYSYGQLLTLALFGLYKEGQADFVQIYTKFLSQGGSRSPAELVGMFGLDIEDSAFWELGIHALRNMVKEFVELSNAK